jgi:hypothetical protein
MCDFAVHTTPVSGLAMVCVAKLAGVLLEKVWLLDTIELRCQQNTVPRFPIDVAVHIPCFEK